MGRYKRRTSRMTSFAHLDSVQESMHYTSDADATFTSDLIPDELSLVSTEEPPLADPTILHSEMEPTSTFGLSDPGTYVVIDCPMPEPLPAQTTPAQTPSRRSSDPTTVSVVPYTAYADPNAPLMWVGPAFAGPLHSHLDHLSDV
eukprot:NODE_6293_length_519_cov_25.495745_g5525_i0.p1 GENE.NODE_6293_length_519_cov_25.495745_g5525_i0~~NODE_6293_length_519_cov_25.495745_g5525_i0.p1  ORF type:complete len:153 (+),score=33.19 NODE_6293_length_519_cov_25.495745_g5525_i0:27-461(+)